ncbi:MAG: hypothetical protein ACFCVD_23365 [Nodosilinea sp.]
MASTSARSTASSRHRRPSQDLRQFKPWEWVWPLLWVVLLTGSGIFGGWALRWLTRIPPLPDCEQITPFHSTSDLLYCAKAQARTGEPNNLVQSVLLTANWPKTSDSYEDSQEILTDSSEQILVLANRWAQAGKLDDAVALAEEIPLNTPLRKPAQSVIYEWRQDWAQGQAIEAEIKTALAASDWERAKAQLQALKTLKSDYWLSTRTVFWQQQILIEQQAWDQLLAARRLAASGQAVDLQQAVALGRSINLRSQVWPIAEKEVDQWSQTLLQAGLEQWQAGNHEAALALVNEVPPSLHLVPAAEDLLRLSQAQTLASKALPAGADLSPRYGHMFYLIEAIGALSPTLEPSPPGAPSAPVPAAFGSEIEGTPSVTQLTEQLDDLRWLKFGNLVAQVGYRPTYQWAISQAQQVKQGRPRRIQGQTLIADWQANIERIEDRPLLAQARGLARPGTILALETAIAKARQVEPGRPLRIEAQTLIAEWQQEIQVIEDRPMLEAAIALADDGKLQEAITEALKIEPGRALHSRAQTLVQDWTATIQIAEDKPILDEAKDLAYEGSLSAAINMASQIGPGRALYGEAKAAIALWTAERAYIWSIWESQGKPTPADSSSNSTESE